MTLPITDPELLVWTMETLMDKAFLFDHKWEKELTQDCRSPPFWAQILQIIRPEWKLAGWRTSFPPTTTDGPWNILMYMQIKDNKNVQKGVFISN